MFKFTAMLLSSVLFSSAAYSADESVKPTLKQTSEYVPGQLIVKYKESAAKSISRPMNAITKKVFRASQAELLEFDQIIDLEKMMSALKRSPYVEYVEFNNIYRLSVVPDDTSFSDLYGMEKISAPLAWEQTSGSKDIVVGVIDTGIDYNHPDLAGNYWTNPGETGLDAEGNNKETNGIDDDENGYVDDFRGWDFINGDNDPMDGNGHGSHCAGTIGAVGNNDEGVVGVNWEVSLVGLKIFSDAGSTTVDAIVEAIEYSTLIGVDVTNNSWGGGGASEPIRSAIAEANEHNILFVAAAGNSRANNDTGSFYPANYELDNIISVAATDSRDQLASFSNYGALKVHVGAPGVDIYSTRPGERYQNLSGTSMAAPHVTGLVALLKSQFPDASMREVKSRVIYLGDDVEALNGKTISGKRINAHAALEIDEISPAPVTFLSLDRSLLDSVHVSIGKTGDDGEEGEAASYEIRISSEPIDEGNWDEAVLASTEPMLSDDETKLSFKVLNLEQNFEGFIAVRAADSTFNLSRVSENLAVKTIETAVAYQNDFTSTDGLTFTGTWGLETVQTDDGEETYLSDSPEGEYSSHANFSATFKEFESPKGVAILSFKTKYDLETRFDNVYVEIAVDGADQWTAIQTLNGSKDWHTVSTDLTDVLEGSQTYQIRFRITSDPSVQGEGVQIDELSILTEVTSPE